MLFDKQPRRPWQERPRRQKVFLKRFKKLPMRKKQWQGLLAGPLTKAVRSPLAVAMVLPFAVKPSARCTDMAKKPPSLSVGRGEKLPVSKGAGLTAKGRAKYNAATGSNLKAPQPQGGKRKDSFCARMSGMPGPMKDEKGKPTRKAAALARWKC